MSDTINRNIPILNPQLRGVIQVSAAIDSSYILTNTSQVYVFGLNQVNLFFKKQYGELGVGDWANRNTPTLVTALNGVGVTRMFHGGYTAFYLTITSQVYATGWGYVNYFI